MTERIKPPLLEGERLDDLQRGGLKIIQHPMNYRFGMDSVLLAHFTALRAGDAVCDLGTGTGVLPLLLSHIYPDTRYTAIEIQPSLADMTRRSVEYNRLGSRIDVREMDLKAAPDALGHGQFDAAVCNPPYKKRCSGPESAADSLRIARHEIACTLGDIARTASKLLKHHGRLFIMQRAERLLELLHELEASGLCAKTLRFVYPKPAANANLVLVYALKGGKAAHTTVLPPLIIYNEDGSQTQELQRIYAQ